METVHTVEFVNELVQLLGKTREDVLTKVLESVVWGPDGAAYIELATLEQKLELRKGFFQEAINQSRGWRIQTLKDQIEALIRKRDLMKEQYKKLNNSPATESRDKKIVRLRLEYHKLIIRKKELDSNLKRLEDEIRKSTAV